MPAPLELTTFLIQANKWQEASIVMAMTNMAEQVEQNGWDQPPWLMMLYRTMPPPDIAAQMQEHGGAMQLMAVQPLGTLPNLSVDIQVAAITNLANTLRTTPQGIDFSPVLGPDMVAWVMVCEGWQLTSDDDPNPVIHVHKIRQHPNRREVRYLLAVDRTGIRYSLTHERDGDTWASIDERSDPDVELAGDQHDALAALMEATP